LCNADVRLKSPHFLELWPEATRFTNSVSNPRKQTTSADNSPLGQVFIGRRLHRHYLHRRERAVVGFVALVHFRCRPISQMVMPPRLWSTETHLGRLGGH